MKLDQRLQKYKDKMESTIIALDRELASIRTNRASPAIVENIKVEAYGSLMPINQLASISVTDPKTLVINVWDNSTVKATQNAILESGLNLNPSIDNQNIKIVLPPLTQERRAELCKIASKSSENAKIALRVIRREANDFIKILEKNKEITEDISKRFNNDIQDLLKQFSDIVDTKVQEKQNNILEV